MGVSDMPVQRWQVTPWFDSPEQLPNRRAPPNAVAGMQRRPCSLLGQKEPPVRLFGNQRCLIVTVVQRGDSQGLEPLVGRRRLRSSIDMTAEMQIESGEPAYLRVAR